MSAHTPGPWSIYPETDGREICAVDYVPGLPIRARVAFPDTNCPQWVANAQLIASAPDLLAALELLMVEVEESGNADARDFGWPRAVKSARAAIAKAKGGAA